MKECPQCGTELPDQARFCLNCGASQDAVSGEPPSVQAQLTGSGAIAQGEGVVAAGEKGVAIGGDVRDSTIITDSQGNVHIGDIVYAKTEVEELREALHDAVNGLRNDLTRRIRRADQTRPEEPYRYLDYFELEHTTVFHGRDAARQKLIREHIQAERHGSRLTLLHAPSGAGKTSLLRAGVVPDLYGDLPVYIHHPREPVATIKQAILPAAPHPEKLAALPLRAFLTWTVEYLDHGETLVILLDQFEEFFIYLTEAQRRPFIMALADCYRAKGLPVKFVLAMRKDYFSDMAVFADELDKVFHNQFLLPALTRDEAKKAIKAPLDGTDMKWEPGAVEALLDYLDRGEIAPPHLQLICSRLYEATREAGQTTISVEGVNLHSIHADYLVEEMSEAPDFSRIQRELGWRLLKRLVTSEGTKQVLPLEKLYEVAPPDKVDPVLKRLVDRRLLRRDESEGETLIEVAHDTLAAEIAAHETDQEKREKVARELVERGLATWQQFERRVEYLMGKPMLRVLDQYRDALVSPGPEALEFLFRSALAAGYEVAYWRDRASAVVGKLEREWFESLDSDDSDQARQAVSGLAALASPSVVRRLTDLVEADFTDVPVTWVDHKGNKHLVRRTVLNVSTLRQRQALLALTKIVLSEATDALDRWTPPGMILIPAGPFMMGSTEFENEGPMHEIVLDAFWIDRYPVTNAQWAAFLEGDGWQRWDLWTEIGWVRKERILPEPDQWGQRKHKRDHPVVGICWYEALAYARWAGKTLLSEAQWEKAARGTNGRPYPWGDVFDPFLCNTGESRIYDTTPVGRYSPVGDSPYGCADIAGNVWEWTASLLRPYPYQSDDGRNNLEGEGARVLRGACFGSKDRARSAVRWFGISHHRDKPSGVRVGVAAPFSPLGTTESPGKEEHTEEVDDESAVHED